MKYENYVVVDKNGKPVKPNFKERFKKGFDSSIKWADEHKEVLMIIVPVAAGVVGFTTKTVIKRANLAKEETLKERYCYDRSLGHYWELNRKLSNKEWLEVDARKKNGERLADIFESMRVLK